MVKLSKKGKKGKHPGREKNNFRQEPSDPTKLRKEKESKVVRRNEKTREIGKHQNPRKEKTYFRHMALSEFKKSFRRCLKGSEFERRERKRSRLHPRGTTTRICRTHTR